MSYGRRTFNARWTATGRQIDVSVHARDLAEGMCARVSPARARHRRRDATHQRRECLLHDLLHGHRIRLPLPAGVVRAVVRNRQFECAHDGRTRAEGKGQRAEGGKKNKTQRSGRIAMSLREP
jgi:hypothetical protein